jgi:hypothetical protein
LPKDSDVLPKDTDSDYSLPGRLEEGNSEQYNTTHTESKPKNRIIWISIVSFVIVFAGFFSYYLMNQNEIDSQIIENTIKVDPEKKLVNQYNVGEYGSDHAHAAIAVFVEGEQLNFGMQQFQLSSKYIHFENHNPYLIHRHAIGVPLEMLFASFNMKITETCIILNYDKLANSKSEEFCTDEEQSLVFYVNGEKYHSDISQYVLEQGDRIMISLGDTESISKNLSYLESLEIADVPKKVPQYSGDEISI